MKYLAPFAAILIIAACNPPRDAYGHCWKNWQVKKRIFSRSESAQRRIDERICFYWFIPGTHGDTCWGAEKADGKDICFGNNWKPEGMKWAVNLGGAGDSICTVFFAPIKKSK